MIDTLFYNLMTALTVSLLLLGFYCFGKVVRHSFKNGTAYGLATMIFPPMTLWYMFARYEHDLKLLVVGTATLGLWVAVSLAALPRLLV